MTKKLTESNISECQAKFNLSYHVPFAYSCQQMVGFEGKDVLEVGGSLPKEFVLDYLNVKSWSALEAPDFEVYLDRVASAAEGSKLGKVDYSAFGFTERELSNYNFFAGYIEELPPAYYQKYDLIFSIAAFEHIHKFPLALEKMFLALKPGGQLFSIFTPILSAHDGHHLPPITEPNQGKTFNFQNSPIPPWGHLLMRPPELCRYLYEHTDRETADAIAYYVYNSPHINRFFTEDYVEFISQSSFIVKRLEPIGLIKIENNTQQTLEKLYPGRTQFTNNGILAILEKPQKEKPPSLFLATNESEQNQTINDENSRHKVSDGKAVVQTSNESDSPRVQFGMGLPSPTETLCVCMMVQNSEKTLAIALESLGKVYDELIIVDGGSTDSTCEIATSYGARIIHSPWQGNHSQQRNIYLQEVKTDWVFVIDSDEFIDLRTLDFLQQLKLNGCTTKTDNFWITRKWISPFSKNHYISSDPHYPDWQRRIFRYNQSLFYSGQIHESIHGLTKPGETLLDLCVYHLDLLIKSESQRQEKVRIYSSVNEKDGMPHYYLPDIRQLTIHQWNHQSLLPKVRNLLDYMPLKCKVCESDSHHFTVAKVLCKYEVDYFKCSNCGFVQTEEPYWLEDAYSQPIASSDVGLAFRNLSFSQFTQNLLFNFFNHQARFLDYGGGYGLFVRLMRDAGFDFYWLDKFCQNIFAQGFEIDAAANNQFELVTAFEVFEHLVHPINELEELLKISRNILLSTELLPESNPKPDEWWYYVLHEGQHVSLYTAKSLSIIATKFNLNFYSNGSSLHLLTEKELPDDLFQQLAKGGLAAVNKVSLLQNDFLKAVSKITNIQHAARIQLAEIEEDGDSRSGLTILVDGVFFQMYKTGIARVWRSLLEEWAENGFAKYIIVLDRVGTSPKIPGIRYCTVPAYDYSKTDTDREMLQQVCDETGADLFISTYYTTPLSTPTAFIAYDMIPEVLQANLQEPMWREKHYGIRHASAYISISENTAQDLTRFFPEISLEFVTIAHCGVDNLFTPASQEAIKSFKNKYGISKPYFISVGGGSDYKNTILFFQAFGKLASKQGFEIVFTGSGILLEGELRIYTAGSVVHKLQLSDEELRLAYSGAVALVYPSLYEGFGLPVLEAMACGCPVITCPNASIPEVAGAAALYVKDDDIDGLTDALCEVQKPKIRNSLIAAGLEQAKKFSWSQMAQTVSSALINATKLTLKETDEQTPQQLDKRKAIEELLVEMRNKPAYQLPLQYDLACIPPQLLNEYIRLLFELPYLFQNIGEVNIYYQHIQRWVDYIHTNIFQHSESNFWHSVALLFKRYAKLAVYFSNKNLKEIYVKRADIIEFALKIQGHQIDFDLPDRSADRDKIRLGILADNFSTQSEIFATLPVYKHLNRDEFEIILYFTNASGHRFEKCCLGYTDVAVKLPQNLNLQVETIRKWELDILFIANNITAQTNTIAELALHRLAPIQVVGMNSPVTTGMRHIDYYISSKLTELENDTQNHYRENLVKLDVPAQCFDFATEEQLIKTLSFQRETTGIPQNAVVYISGANFFKILPEVEETWIKIIAAVPDAVLVLYPFNPNWAPIYPVTAFKQRLVATLAKYGLDADRLILLDAAPNRADVKERLKVADIYLDSYPYAGMTSLIDPLEIGLPTVVMSGNYARSNMGASLLRELQMPDLIADSEESYIDLAIALGINPDLRQQKSTCIKQKMQANPAFLDSRSYSDKIGSLFKEIFYKHQVDGLRDNLTLREINLIIFPDWSQPEELLLEELAVVIKATATHQDKSKITLLVDYSNISEEDANLALSSVAMNILMEEDLDVSEGPETLLIGQLSEIQWQALRPRLHGRIILEHENKEAIAYAGCKKISSYLQDSFTTI